MHVEEEHLPVRRPGKTSETLKPGQLSFIAANLLSHLQQDFDSVQWWLGYEEVQLLAAWGCWGEKGLSDTGVGALRSTR